MASRNVDLLIRARDNASRAFKTVSESLEELEVIQKGVATGSGKMDAALSKTATVAATVEDRIKRTGTAFNQAEQVFERIGATVKKASESFQKQKSDLTEAREAYKALSGQAKAAGVVIENSNNKIGPQTQKQAGDLRLVKKAYKDLTAEVSRSGASLNKQENQLADNAAELDRVRSAAQAAGAALREVSRQSQAAQGVGANQSQTKAANDSAQRGIAHLSRLEKDLQAEIAARPGLIRRAAIEQSKAHRTAAGGLAELFAAEKRINDQKERFANNKAAVTSAQEQRNLTALTAALIRKAQIEERSAQATRLNKQLTDELNASYDKQRAVAPVSAGDQEKLAAAFRQSFTAASQARGPIAGVWKELVRVGPAADQAASGVRRLSGQMTNGRQAFRAFYGDSRKALSLMQRMRGEVLSLTASFVGFYGVFNVGKGILEFFQRLEAAQNRLGAAFDQDYDKVNAELARLNEEASRLGISFDVLSANFSNFLISGQQAGLEVDQLRTIFRQVSEAGRVLKLSNEQIEGTFNAMIQIAGKGTLQMEELRQQLGDRLPGAVGLLAKALGYGEGELAQFYKDVTDGAVGAEEALVALGQGLEDQYGGQLENALDSVTAKVGNLQNLLFQRQLTAANSGFIEGLETALEALNEWLDSPEGIEFFEALGSAFGKLFEVLPVVLDNMGTLVTLVQAFAAIKIGQVVSGMAANFTRLGAVTVNNMRVQFALNRAVASFSPAAAGALRSATLLGAGLRGMRQVVSTLLVTFRAAFASIGGIIGIAAAALSVFAFDAMASTTDATENLSDALSDAEDTIGLVGKAFQEAAGDAGVFKDKLEEINDLDIKLDLKGLRDTLNGQTGGGNRDAISGVITQVWELEKAIGETVKNPQALAYFKRLTNLFDAGKISAADLRKGIQDLSSRFSEIANVSGLDDFVDWLDILADAEDKIARMEAELAVIAGTASDAQKELLGVATATEETDEKAKAAAKEMAAFEAAMRELGELVPSINAKLEEFDAIREIEANFQAAMEAANAFTDAAQRAAAIGSAVDLRNQAYGGYYDGQVQGYDGTDGSKVAAQFLRDRERFEPEAYNDPRTDSNGKQVGENIYRAGYGSNTITLSDKTVVDITKGMRVSVADAERDLERRINQEFKPAARSAVGSAKFDSLNAQQQAALISLAYNYGAGAFNGGALAGVAAAVKNGSNSDVAAAIKARSGDNGGKNRGRRAQEAALFTTSAGVENASDAAIDAAKDRAEAAKDLAEDQAEFRQGLKDEIEDTKFLNSLEGQRMIDAEVAKALRDAENDAKEVGLKLTKEERAEIEKTTRAKFAIKQSEEDRTKQLEKAKKLEEDVTLLNERRRYLAEQITLLEGNGDLVGAAKAGEELLNVESQLDSAIEKAIAFWEAMGGEGSERAILALKNTQQELKIVNSTAITTGKQLNDMFANRMTQAIENFNQRVANGEDALVAFKDEFLKMASDILVELGRMIIQQALFNALSGAFGGGAGGNGGVGGGVAGLINGLFHNGGTVGAGSQRSARAISPAVFANAARYHSGGIAGLAPDEMGAILKKNEEILTESDPRHRFNGGASSGGGGGTTIINSFDAEEVMERALSTPRGQKVLVNAVRGSNTEIKAVLG